MVVFSRSLPYSHLIELARVFSISWSKIGPVATPDERKYGMVEAKFRFSNCSTSACDVEKKARLFWFMYRA